MIDQVGVRTKYDLVFVVTYIDQKHIGSLLKSIYDYNTVLSVLVVLVEQGGMIFDIEGYVNSNILIKKIDRYMGSPSFSLF